MAYEVSYWQAAKEATSANVEAPGSPQKRQKTDNGSAQVVGLQQCYCFTRVRTEEKYIIKVAQCMSVHHSFVRSILQKLY